MIEQLINRKIFFLTKVLISIGIIGVFLNGCTYEPARLHASVVELKQMKNFSRDYIILVERYKSHYPTGHTQIVRWGTPKYTNLSLDIYVYKAKTLRKVGSIGGYFGHKAKILNWDDQAIFIQIGESVNATETQYKTHKVAWNLNGKEHNNLHAIETKKMGEMGRGILPVSDYRELGLSFDAQGNLQIK